MSFADVVRLASNFTVQQFLDHETYRRRIDEGKPLFLHEFLYALIFLAKSEVRTVPVGVITELIRGDVFYWGQLMAAALLGAIPVAVIYSFFVDYYVAGLTAGSVKS